MPLDSCDHFKQRRSFKHFVEIISALSISNISFLYFRSVVVAVDVVVVFDDVFHSLPSQSYKIRMDENGQNKETNDERFIHGHCACGSLRFKIDIQNIANDLTLSMFCHCSRCQRLNGAPYIWSNHWSFDAVQWFPLANRPPPGAPGNDGKPNSIENGGEFSPNMQTFETMKGRKWKLRCKDCGSPMGSWNAAKGK